jgi:hypothetical protein
MQAATLHLPTATTEKFPLLELVARPHVPTEQAAYYLNRKPQTLREWAMTGRVIQPHRLNGRLAWPVADIRRVLGVSK